MTAAMTSPTKQGCSRSSESIPVPFKSRDAMMQVLLMQDNADTHLNAVTTIIAKVRLGPTTHLQPQPFVGSFYHTALTASNNCRISSHRTTTMMRFNLSLLTLALASGLTRPLPFNQIWPRNKLSASQHFRSHRKLLRVQIISSNGTPLR
jgi:hypothetical protein